VARSGPTPSRNRHKGGEGKSRTSGRVDRNPHLTGFPGVAVAPDNVLRDLQSGKRRHGLTHLAVQDVLGLAVGRVLQFGRIQRVEMMKRPIFSVDEELVLLQGVNTRSN